MTHDLHQPLPMDDDEDSLKRLRAKIYRLNAKTKTRAERGEHAALARLRAALAKPNPAYDATVTQTGFDPLQGRDSPDPADD